MSGVLMLADDGWLEYQRNSPSGIAAYYANPSKKVQERFDYLFCVRHGRLPRPIVASGRIADQATLPPDQAWKIYGAQPGASNEIAWKMQANVVIENANRSAAGEILVIVLKDFQFFEEPISPVDVGLDDKNWQNKKDAGAESTAALLDRLQPKLRAALKNVAPWQQDVERRQRIERAAVRAAWDHFAREGYKMRSVERENCGWDLEGTSEGETLRIEVKGTSGKNIVCEVTPNEYLPIAAKRSDYCLCIVCDALREPGLKLFRWSTQENAWCSNGERLSIETMTGARIRA